MSELDLRSVAKRVVWFKSPEDALHDKNLFLAHLMTYGTLRDITTVLDSFPEADFEAVLDNPPPGVFELRSWTFWNVRYHREPIPPLPTPTYSLVRLNDPSARYRLAQWDQETQGSRKTWAKYANRSLRIPPHLHNLGMDS